MRAGCRLVGPYAQPRFFARAAGVSTSSEGVGDRHGLALGMPESQ